MIFPIYNAINRLLSRMTAARADFLDNLNGFVGSAYNLARAIKIDLLDAAISSRLASNDARLNNLDAAISTASGRWHRQAFTSSGSFTVPAGITEVWVSGCGGGGGGGGGASSSFGGGGGEGGAGVWRHPYTVTGQASITVSLGQGGAAGAYGSNGGAGGNTLFGDLVISGGEGGRTSSSGYKETTPQVPKISGGGMVAGGAGGSGGWHETVVETTVNHPPLIGQGVGINFGGGAGTGTWGGGGGGAALFGPGGKGGNSGVDGAVPTSGYGGGGGAGGRNNRVGGAGKPGYLFVEWFA